MSGDPNQPGDSPNNAEHGQNIPPGNSGDQQNMSLNNASYQQDLPPNNAGHGENIPPNNMSGGVYGGSVKPEYSNTGPKNMEMGGQQNHAPDGGSQSRNVPGRDAIDLPPNNAGHGVNIPPNNMSGGVYGGSVVLEYSNTGRKIIQLGGQQNHAPDGGSDSGGPMGASNRSVHGRLAMRTVRIDI